MLMDSCNTCVPAASAELFLSLEKSKGSVLLASVSIGSIVCLLCYLWSLFVVVLEILSITDKAFLWFTLVTVSSVFSCFISVKPHINICN